MCNGPSQKLPERARVRERNGKNSGRRDTSLGSAYFSDEDTFRLSGTIHVPVLQRYGGLQVYVLYWNLKAQFHNQYQMRTDLYHSCCSLFPFCTFYSGWKTVNEERFFIPPVFRNTAIKALLTVWFFTSGYVRDAVFQTPVGDIVALRTLHVTDAVPRRPRTCEGTFGQRWNIDFYAP